MTMLSSEICKIEVTIYETHTYSFHSLYMGVPCIIRGSMAIILKATSSLGPVSWELLNYSIGTKEDY